MVLVTDGATPHDVLWGLGSGRRVRSLLRDGGVVEVLALDVPPDDGRRIDAIVGACASLSSARASGRLRIHLGTPADLARRWSLVGAATPQPRIHIDVAALATVPEPAQPLARLITRLHDERRDHARFASTLRANLATNLDAIATAPSLSEFTGAARGRPGFVIAAGPSATAAMPWLADARGLGPIIAVDTCLPLLRAHGVAIDWLASVDPHPTSKVHLQRGTADVGRLAFQPYCTPAMVDAFDRRALALPAGDVVCERVGAELDLPVLPVAGTVLLFALQIAVILGCDPVIAIGADLAHVGGQSHATGTATARPMAPSGATVLDRGGRPVPTSTSLLGFLAEIEHHVAHAATRSWFVDGGGARVRGARMIDGRAVARWMKRSASRVDTWRDDRNPAARAADEVADRRACWRRHLAEVDAG